MRDRASFQTVNALQQFLHRNRTLILVHTVKGATFEMEQKPIQHSVNIAYDYDVVLIQIPTLDQLKLTAFQKIVKLLA